MTAMIESILQTPHTLKPIHHYPEYVQVACVKVDKSSSMWNKLYLNIKTLIQCHYTYLLESKNRLTKTDQSAI